MAIRLAKAPYWRGPRIRAASIVKPYVATFMTPIATAIDAAAEQPLERVARLRRHAASLEGRPSCAWTGSQALACAAWGGTMGAERHAAGVRAAVWSLVLALLLLGPRARARATC